MPRKKNLLNVKQFKEENSPLSHLKNYFDESFLKIRDVAKQLDGLKCDFSCILSTHLAKFQQSLINLYSDTLRSARNFDIYPDNLKYHCKLGKNNVFVVEHKPQVRNLIFRKGMLTFVNEPMEALAHRTHDWLIEFIYNDTRSVLCPLSLPYLIFIFFIHDTDDDSNFHLDRLYVFYRNKPLTSLKDMLMCSNLSNIRDDGSVCLGRYSNKFDKKMTGVQIIDNVINYFYNSEFNVDYSTHMRRESTRTPSLKNLNTWMQHTKNDPGFILSVNFTNYQSLDYFLKERSITHGLFDNEKLFDLANNLVDDIRRDFRRQQRSIVMPKASEQMLNKALKGLVIDLNRQLNSIA